MALPYDPASQVTALFSVNIRQSLHLDLSLPEIHDPTTVRPAS
jgi:hypothetical protein